MNGQHPRPPHADPQDVPRQFRCARCRAGPPRMASQSDPAAGSDPRRAFRTSLSVSPFTEAVLGSLSLTDGHRTATMVRQVQQLFNRHGATEVFARVATLRVN